MRKPMIALKYYLAPMGLFGTQIALIIFIICSLCAPISSFAQADSLLKVAEGIQDQEFKRAHLDSLATAWAAEYRPEAAAFFEALLVELDPIKADVPIMAKVSSYARYLIDMGQVEKAREVMMRYSSFAEGTADLDQKRNYYYNLSFIEEILENRESALELIDHAIVASEKLKDSTRITFGEVYKAKGRVCYSIGEFVESVVNLNRAKEIFVAVGDSIGISESLWELGTVHAMIGLYDESERFLMERRKFQAADPVILNFQDAVNLGRNDLQRSRYESAYIRFKKALVDTASLDIYSQVYVFNGLIESAYFSGQKNEVTTVYDAMLRSCGVLQDEPGLDFMFEQSRFFRDLVAGDFLAAESNVLKLYQASLDKKDGSEAVLHTKFLTELYKAQGADKKALKYSEEYARLRDSILTANKTNALLLYQTQFETKEKEGEIIRLDNERRIEESLGNTLLAIALGLLAVLAIGGILFVQLRKARNSLSQQNVELEKLNTTKDKFMGIIGHDLRNPIITFEALGDRIRRQKAKGQFDAIDDTVDLIERNTQQVGGLLDNLMRWVLSQKGVMRYKPETIPMNDFLQENVDLFRELAHEKEIELKLEVDKDLVLQADRNALSGICRNLISNAVKFTPSGGAVLVSAVRSDQEVNVHVKDTGEGIPEEMRMQLFSLGKESQRGTAGETGTGLGLVLVKELVDLNKASIEVHSEQGGGTEFVVRFPQ